jgi:hypothetical protein
VRTIDNIYNKMTTHHTFPPPNSLKMSSKSSYVTLSIYNKLHKWKIIRVHRALGFHRIVFCFCIDLTLYACDYCLDVILAGLKQFVGLERHEILLVRCATKATNCRIKLHLVTYVGYQRYGTGKVYLRSEAYLRREAST